MVALRSAIRQNLGLEWTAQANPSDPVLPEHPAVASMEELEEGLVQAIAAAEQPPAFDVSALQGQPELPMAVKNLYYGILNRYPEYKYAYDLTASVDADGVLHCAISYMPYRTGDYPADFQGVEVDSLAGLVRAAQEGLSQAHIPIRITTPTLAVDDMNRVLQQVGGSWLLCQLNRDGTEITVTPQNGLSQEAALARLEETKALAVQIYHETVSAGASSWEQAEALYIWLTDQVKYDHRYYAAPAEMPYESMTAYGALHDHLAICGGYAQALQLLFEQAGIPCMTVNGRMGGENHMWNLAKVDGQWLYFDATSDRGRSAYGFSYFGVGAEDLVRYTWDQSTVQRWAEALFP